MTWFELAKNIFAIIGLIAVLSVLGGLFFIIVFGKDFPVIDEHSNVKEGRPC